MLHISHIYDGAFPSDSINKLDSVVDNYHLESLSILRSTKKTGESVKEEIESKLKESRKRLAELKEVRKQMSEYSQIINKLVTFLLEKSVLGSQNWKLK